MAHPVDSGRSTPPPQPAAAPVVGSGRATSAETTPSAPSSGSSTYMPPATGVQVAAAPRERVIVPPPTDQPTTAELIAQRNLEIADALRVIETLWVPEKSFKVEGGKKNNTGGKTDVNYNYWFYPLLSDALVTKYFRGNSTALRNLRKARNPEEFSDYIKKYNRVVTWENQLTGADILGVAKEKDKEFLKRSVKLCLEGQAGPHAEYYEVKLSEILVDSENRGAAGDKSKAVRDVFKKFSRGKLSVDDATKALSEDERFNLKARPPKVEKESDFPEAAWQRAQEIAKLMLKSEGNTSPTQAQIDAKAKEIITDGGTLTPADYRGVQKNRWWIALGRMEASWKKTVEEGIEKNRGDIEGSKRDIADLQRRQSRTGDDVESLKKQTPREVAKAKILAADPDSKEAKTVENENELRKELEKARDDLGVADTDEKKDVVRKKIHGIDKTLRKARSELDEAAADKKEAAQEKVDALTAELKKARARLDRAGFEEQKAAIQKEIDGVAGALEKAVAAVDKVIEEKLEGKDTVTNKLFVGAVDIGKTSSPLVRNKINLELSAGDFQIETEFDINRGFSPGQGTDPTNLFGPGPGGKIGEGGLGLSYVSLSRKFLESVTVKGGLNEVWWEGAPLQGFFGKAVLPAKTNYQLGFLALYNKVFYKNDQISWSFDAGAAGGILADDINLMGGLGFVKGKDEKWAKQLDASTAVKAGFKLSASSEKSSVAIRGHVVATNKDDDTASDVMINVAGRFFLDRWQFGVDWRPFNSLSLVPGQVENTQWALSTELGFSVAPFLFKLSANHFSGRLVRSNLTESEGVPATGTPEQSVTTTSLTDVGLGAAVEVNKCHKFVVQGFKAWAPEGSGWALKGMWQLNWINFLQNRCN